MYARPVLPETHPRAPAGILEPRPEAGAAPPPRLGRALLRTAATLGAFLLACGVVLWLARDSDAATAAVVNSIVYIVVADSLITLICNRLGI